jgi:hypothetical protein
MKTSQQKIINSLSLYFLTIFFSIFIFSCQEKQTDGMAPAESLPSSPSISDPTNAAPIVSPILDQTIYEGRSKTVGFNLSDSDSSMTCATPNVSLQSSNLSLLPLENIVLGGTYPDCTLRIEIAPGQSGLSTVTINASDTVTTTSQSFVVTGFKIDSVVMSPLNPIIPKNSNFSFSLTAVYSDTSSRNITGSATWTTSNLALSIFTMPGVLNNTFSLTSTATSTISATYGGFSVSTLATFNPATITSLIVDISAASLNIAGELQLNCYGLTSDGGSINLTGSCLWASENPLIIAVDNSLDKGLVTGVSLGSPTNITATYGSFSAIASIEVDTNPPMTSDNGLGLTAKYYLGNNFNTLANTRIDSTVNFNWSTGNNPAGSNDSFSVRWTGFFKAPVTGTYTFYTLSDDGTRLQINNTSIVNNWTDHATTENSGTIALVAGQKYPITLEFYENGGYAEMRLLYSAPGVAKQFVPQINLFP